MTMSYMGYHVTHTCRDAETPKNGNSTLSDLLFWNGGHCTVAVNVNRWLVDYTLLLPQLHWYLHAAFQKYQLLYLLLKLSTLCTDWANESSGCCKQMLPAD